MTILGNHVGEIHLPLRVSPAPSLSPPPTAWCPDALDFRIPIPDGYLPCRSTSATCSRGTRTSATPSTRR
jgi:hypothetical protein